VSGTRSKKFEAQKGMASLILQHARGILGTRDNHLGLVVASLLCLVVSAFTVFPFSIVYQALQMVPMSESQYEMAPIVLGVVFLLFSFWLAGPLYLGALRIAANASAGRDFSLSQMFVFYSSLSLFARAWRILSGTFFRLIIVGASICAVVAAFTEPWAGAEPWILVGGGVCLLPLWVLATAVSYPVSALAVSDLSLPIRVARHRGRAMTRKHRRALAILHIELLLLFAVSLLSVGVVTLFYVIPLMFAARISALSLLAE
jgi:hypothetical protein